MFFLVLIFLFSPFYVDASVFIHEVMYDVSGSDSGREWIEIVNNGEADVDLSGWKLFEANTNHGLTLVSGSASLSPHGYAVIVDNPEKFAIDFPSFSGIVFDSSFSLNNTGEVLTLRDQNLTDIDTVNYSNQWGGAGDGNSLQRENTEWKGAIPTPGQENNINNVFTPDPEVSLEEDTVKSPQQNESSSSTQNVSIKIQAQTIGLVHTPLYFEAKVTGLGNDTFSTLDYIWNFGDGEIFHGQSVSHNYSYPGKYIVVLETIYGNERFEDKVTITIQESGVKISSTSPGSFGRIDLTNLLSSPADLSFFILKTNEHSFTIPQNTFISSKGVLSLSSSITGLSVGSLVTLHYPNGILATTSSSLTPLENPKAKTPSVSSPKREETEEKYILPSKSASISPNTSETLSSSSQLVAQLSTVKSNSFLPWLFALLGLIGVPLLALFFLPKKQQTEADEIEIIE